MFKGVQIEGRQDQSAGGQREEMLQSFFLISKNGEVLIEKHWRDVTPRSVCDYFWDEVNKYETEGRNASAGPHDQVLFDIHLPRRHVLCGHDNDRDESIGGDRVFASHV